MPLPPPSLAEEAPRERSAVYIDADQPEEAYLQPASVQLSHLPQSQQSPAALLQGRGYEDSSLPPHPGLAEHALPPSSPAASRPLVSGPKPPTPPQHHRGAAPAAGTAHIAIRFPTQPSDYLIGYLASFRQNGEWSQKEQRARKRPAAYVDPPPLSYSGDKLPLRPKWSPYRSISALYMI